MSDEKRKSSSSSDRRRTWTKRARNDRRSSQNKNWMLPLYISDARDGNDRRSGLKMAPERVKKLPVLPKIFRVRSIYLKVNNMDAARAFYSGFLGIEPKKDGNVWCEFPMGNMNLGLLLEKTKGKGKDINSSFVPIFEFADNEIFSYIGKAKSLGAKLIHDYMNEGQGQSVLMEDPFGNQFQISREHD